MDLRQINFGIEIETIRRTREQVAHAIQSVVGGQVTHLGGDGNFDPWEVIDPRGRHWKVVGDGSLVSVPAYLRAEIVSPILAYADIPLLQDVVRAVRRCGATVDARCGIHVHIDATAFDGRTLGNLAKIIYKQQALILTALGVSEERRRNYSRPISDDLIARIERRRPRTRDELNIIWYRHHNRRPQHYDTTRYHGVNLHSVWYRGTVEFRWFESTLHAGKVKAYIQLVLAVAAKALNGRSASSDKRQYDPTSARYDFRVFLLRLGLIGDEFKTARKHLLAALPGDSAFKRGRPTPVAQRASQGDAAHAPSGPIPLPSSVWQGIEAVRRSGLTNMLDRPEVARLAVTLGYAEAGDWITAHRDEYAAGIFRGFVIDSKGGKA